MKRISAFSLNGSRQAPLSKSHFIREVMLSILAQGPSVLKGDFRELPTDAQSALEVARQLGAVVEIGAEDISIYPPIIRQREDIHLFVGESGFLLRSMIPISLLFAKKVSFTATGTLIERNQNFVLDAMTGLGCKVWSKPGEWPLIVERPQSWPKTWTLDGSESSQLISGLLILASQLTGNHSIQLNQVSSAPYLELTLSCLGARGIEFSRPSLWVFEKTEFQCIEPKVISIQGDWSGAANFLVGAAIGGTQTIYGLQTSSFQADEAILSILKDYGAKVSVAANAIVVSKVNNRAFNCNISNCPDLFPILCVLAASASGQSEILGTHRLSNKESDRLKAACDMLDHLGCTYRLLPNLIQIQGGVVLKNSQFKSYHDHRMVMALVMARLLSEEDIFIDELESVKKSYPNFFSEMF